MKGRVLRSNGNLIPFSSFQSRKESLGSHFLEGTFLKNPQQGQQSPLDTMGDPQMMEGMLDGMKKNMFMIVPQTFIFGWVNFFFSGFVLSEFLFFLLLLFFSSTLNPFFKNSKQQNYPSL